MNVTSLYDPSSGYSPQIVDLIRRTVAKDCDDDEFRVFMHMAKRLALDPLRKQIYCFVFHKNDRNRRSMSIVTGIDGFRAVAQRHGDYRPDDQPPRFTIDPDMADASKNPLGIVSVSTTVYKQDTKTAQWHAINGTAYWDEFAPLKERWAYDQDLGKDAPTGEYFLDPKKDNWRRMPRIMILKCAEAQALRRGWPDDLSNVYEHSEIDRASLIDADPVDLVAQAQRSYREARIGGPAIMVAFDISEPLRGVPAGQLADKAIEHVRSLQSSAKIKWFQDTNAEALRQLWAHDPSAALQLKKEIEERIKDTMKAEREAAE